MIKKILFPTDFSPMAYNAYKYALSVAANTSAQLDVVHAYRVNFGVPMPEMMSYKLMDVCKEDSKTQLKEFIDAAKVEGDVPENIEVNQRSEMGTAADVILDISKRDNYDLIIMGTKGEHNLSEVLLGSVTTHVLRHASCPILVIPGDVVPKKMEQIAYATMLTKDNSETIATVSTAAKWLGGDKIYCLHVDTNNTTKPSAIEKFEELLKEENEFDLELVKVNNTSLKEGINRFIAEKSINALIMMRPEHSFFERIFGKSATREMALQARVPLLIFKASEN